jgi:hypothetical protein
VSKPLDEARQLIESRLAEIETEAVRLERAVASLGEGRARQGRRPGRPTKVTMAPPKP